MMENHSFDNIFGLYPTSGKGTSNPLLSIHKPDNLIGMILLVLLYLASRAARRSKGPRVDGEKAAAGA